MAILKIGGEKSKTFAGVTMTIALDDKEWHHLGKEEMIDLIKTAIEEMTSVREAALLALVDCGYIDLIEG